MVGPGGFDRRFGARSAEEIVRQEVLHLTYTANDLAPFARDQGYLGAPFAWDPEDRFRRRARLDAVFMLLYGFSRDEAAYTLETFPIVREQEETQFEGRYMAALEAGNPDAAVAG